MEHVFDSTVYLTQKFKELEGSFSHTAGSNLDEIRKSAFKDFAQLGFPTFKHEEWKYTNVTSILKNGFEVPTFAPQHSVDFKSLIISGTEDDNHLFFVNGVFDTLSSKIVSSPNQLSIKPFYEAELGSERQNMSSYFGVSSSYCKDGIGALNTAFANDGVYIEVKENQIIEKPVHLHFIGDGTLNGVLSLPRNLIVLNKNSQVKLVETFTSTGHHASLTNIVTEIIVKEDAVLEYYKIQLEESNANHVGTTHILQTGKSVAHSVTVSLSGGVVRNNLNMVLDAQYSEANMHGLYLIDGETQVDNHTVADHRKPNCLSNELYKGILDGYSSGVFNGKIFVQPDAQKTNAYQSNKNILLSNNASINTKPQLEIFADDVKCSHGCTTGQLDEDALFYLRSRGISERTAKAMLTKAYVQDILNTVNIPPLKSYLEGLIELQFEQSVEK